MRHPISTLPARPPTDAAAHRADPQRLRFAAEMVEGLLRSPKQTSPKWFYDARGSALFEAITELPEYTLTRTEIALMQAQLPAMVDGIGAGAVVVEPGSGSSRKTALLLAALDRPSTYAAIDISASALDAANDALRERFPGLALVPVAADFTRTLEWPAELAGFTGPRLGFFPGSTLGNFAPDEAVALLSRFRAMLGAGSHLLLGLDTVKDPATMVRAYDDAAGVTAAFNRNLLVRIAAELGADVDPGAFAHEARWNPADSRIEMHLVSCRAQSFELCGRRIAFAAGETVHTESSYKYDAATARALFRDAGWAVDGCWMAAGDAFAVYRLQG
jgi:dimethylhistidine N-methyltransferase